MRSDQRHIIKRQLLELQSPELRKAGELQEFCSRLFRERVVSEIDRILSEICRPDELIRLDKLELQLEPMTMEELETELPKRVCTHLRETLIKKIYHYRSDVEKEGITITKLSEFDMVSPTGRGPLESLIFYLRTGMTPWWQTKKEFDPEALLIAAWQEHPKALARETAALLEDPSARKRLISRLREADLWDLLSEAVPKAVTELKKIKNQVEQLSRWPEWRLTSGPMESRLAVMNFALDMILGTGAPTDRRQDIEMAFLQHLRRHFPGKPLRDIRKQHQSDDRKSPGDTTEKAAQSFAHDRRQDMADETSENGQPNNFQDPRWDAADETNRNDSHPDFEVPETTSDQPNTADPLEGAVPAAKEVSEDKSPQLLAGLELKDEAKAETTPLSASVEQEQNPEKHSSEGRSGSGEEPKATDGKPKESGTDNNKESDGCHLATSRQQSTEDQDADHQTISQLPPENELEPESDPVEVKNRNYLRTTEPKEQNDTAGPSAEEKQRTKQSEEEPDFQPPKSWRAPLSRFRFEWEQAVAEGLVVPNSGLVLLGPYLLYFFDSLGLLEQKQFRDATARRRAVQLLHYVYSGQEQGEEHYMVLNKLMCGLPLGDFVAPEFRLNDAEKEECDQLLEAVIRNWSALKGVSIEGFRRTFLQKPGLLGKEQHGWLLRIQRSAVDILLERLPWSVAVIRLPWNDYLLHVEW